jgi:hypothetical protein
MGAGIGTIVSIWWRGRGYPGVFCVRVANTGLISARVKKSAKTVTENKGVSGTFFLKNEKECGK